MKIFAYCGFAVVVFLGGCSYFDMGEKAPEVASKTEALDLTNKEKIPAQPVTANISDLISSKSEGSVEYFPLDGPAPSASAIPVAENTLPEAPIGDGLPPRRNMSDNAISVAPVPGTSAPSTGSVVIPANPNVTIYPLDDNMRSALPPEVLPQASGSFQSSGLGNTLGDKVAVIYFDHGSVALDSGDFETVRSIAARIAGGNVTVTGFASPDSTIDDPVRRKISNLKVSMDRALSAVRALAEQGVAPERITAVAYGEVRPAETAERSRRVEISGL